jgi:DNA-binding HxlR family transcriptional regulator
VIPGSAEEDWREDCAPRRILELFVTKWTSMVLHTLHARHDGQARSGVLLRSLPGISKKMFAQTVREMEASGLLTRIVNESANPPEVSYALSRLGRRFVVPVEALYAWARDNGDALDALVPRSRSRRRA